MLCTMPLTESARCRLRSLAGLCSALFTASLLGGTKATRSPLWRADRYPGGQRTADPSRCLNLFMSENLKTKVTKTKTAIEQEPCNLSGLKHDLLLLGYATASNLAPYVALKSITLKVLSIGTH
jgi:hypothetical protein